MNEGAGCRTALTALGLLVSSNWAACSAQHHYTGQNYSYGIFNFISCILEHDMECSHTH